MRLARINIARTLLAGTALGAIVLALVWFQRRPIAASAIDRALAARGVRASYTITDIGFRTQLIENLRLGDPAHPDLTAERVELSLVPSWGGIAVAALDARGVRLRGRVVQGQVSWGELDQLMPAPTGKPFALPAINVRLADTHLLLATEMGVFSAEITGSGALNHGFHGQVRATSPLVSRGGCRLESPVAVARVTITRRRLQLAGLLTAAPSTCATAATGPLQVRFDVTLNEAVDNWMGRSTIATPGLRQGALQVANAAADISFAGTAAATRGTFNLSSPAVRNNGTRIAGLTANGTFRVGKLVIAGGAVRVARAIADPGQVTSLRRALSATAGTPLGPLGEMLSQAVGRAGQGAAVDAAFAYRQGSTRISPLRIAAPGGANLMLSNGAIVVDAKGLAIDGDLKLSGGGFPTVRAHLNRAADGSTRGRFDVAPYRAGGAQLALEPVSFASRGDGTMRVETVAAFDGPLGDGRAEGVRVPLVVQRTLSGAVLVAPGCVPVAYRRIAFAGTVLAAGSVTLCPTQGGAIISSGRGGISGGAQTGPLRLAGQVGDQPLLLTATRAAFSLNGPVSFARLSAKLGPVERQTSLFIAQLDGTFGRRGLTGQYAGLSGNIAQVPIVASVGKGDWSLAGGGLTVDGSITIADQAVETRFNPLLARDLRLQVKAGRIVASGTLFEPVSNRSITTVTINHDLARGAGEARLSVNALSFSKSLQPEALTPLTVGVVADLYGRIDGDGVVRWNGTKVTSGGKFRTDGLGFAAAFGPVAGASGEIEFDDLIALSTAPHQQVKLALVNPGIEVKEGVISFRLHPDRVVEIERGRWPFAGGELVLDAGKLDLGRLNPRTLSFRVVALDAAKFIEQLKLENISATGTFDGTLPIVFDATGGRIVGGRIVARAGGGTLAYVGDVSNAETNTLAKLAFDALKSMRYGNLAIDLDGSLDGEIVSLVRFDGVNQSPVAPTGLAKSFTNLPFKFNIRVRAPFRGLVNTARSYQDPGLLLSRTVQPVASDKRQ